MNWRPMTEHAFPWDHEDLIIAAFASDDDSSVEVFRCVCAEHGALFPKGGGMLSIIELGWVPFAFCVGDVPERDDVAFPPLRTDYLTTE